MWQNHGRRVVEIPELLTLIVRELNTREQRKLLSVSQHFFRLIGPTAWKRVPRLDLLLKVIEGTEVKFSIGEMEWPYYEFRVIQITSALPLKPDLSRYHIYAPWVQELEIFGGYSQEIYYTGPFLALLRGNPPLPNLRRLTANTGADVHSKPMMNFFDMFMSPSLTEVRTIFHDNDHPTYIHPSLVPGFLQKVQTTCPQIQVLEFYPGTHSICDTPVSFIMNDQCCRAIESFSNLRSFNSTTCILHPKLFSVLGHLPCLESLVIRDPYREDSVLNEGLSVPEDQFRRLVDLQLYDLDPQDINVLWGQPSIVKKLSFALIQTSPYSALDGNHWIESFLTALPSLCPDLRGLIFDARNERGIKYEISEGTLNALDSLHKLVLKNVTIQFGNLGDDEDWETETYDDGD